MTRRNPKKDKTARRRRPDRTSDARMRTAQIDFDGLVEGMMNAPPEITPLLGLAGVWLWNVQQDGNAAAHCVDAGQTIHYALGHFGLDSRVESVGLVVSGNGSRTKYGGDGPQWNPDGSFNGHVVVIVPPAGRFVDPTIQQFREVPATSGGQAPLVARLPAGTGLGEQPFGVLRGDHEVLYLPVPPAQRQAWRSPRIAAAEASYRAAGLHLASNVFDMMRLEEIRDRLQASPYPRLRQLCQAIGDAETIVDSSGYRFRDRQTGAQLRLNDVK